MANDVTSASGSYSTYEKDQNFQEWIFHYSFYINIYVLPSYACWKVSSKTAKNGQVQKIEHNRRFMNTFL
jgi:hypothetical protein